MVLYIGFRVFKAIPSLLLKIFLGIIGLTFIPYFLPAVFSILVIKVLFFTTILASISVLCLLL